MRYQFFEDQVRETYAAMHDAVRVHRREPIRHLLRKLD